LIAAAKRQLTSNPEIVFVRRYITRAADAGGEAHITVSMSDFTALAGRGGFALHWQAHGLHYGIPASIEADLSVGRTVVANVSRTVVPAARQRFRRLVVAHITADPAVRARRLAQRGRETEAEILARLERAGVIAPEGDDVVTIDNGGTLENAVVGFLGLLSIPA